MIYISYGVPKSASTFTYVVTETVLKAAGYAPRTLSEAAKGGRSRLNYIAAMSWSTIERVRSEIGEKWAVIKTHGAPDAPLVEAIERGEVFASVVIRDPREIALSLLDHGRRSRSLGIADFAKSETITDTFKVLDDSIKRLARWMNSSKVLLLTYDEISFDTESAVQRIIDQLGISVGSTTVMSALPDSKKIRQFNKGTRNRHESEMSVETQQIFLERYADFYRRYLGLGSSRKVSNLGQHIEASSQSRASRPAAIAAGGGPDMTPPASTEEALAPQLVQALYRLLLFREPDVKELQDCVDQIKGGLPIDTVMQQLLKSAEFAENYSRFSQAYISSQRATVRQAVPGVAAAPLGSSGDISKRISAGERGSFEAISNSTSESSSEHVIFVHSHRRSGTHFLLDTIRAWFDVPEQIQTIPNPAVVPYAPHSLSKDHEPFRGFKLAQRHVWGPPEQLRRGRRLYDTGTHIYIVRNPLQVLRSAYIFDVSGAEQKFKVDPKTTFLEYLTAPSLHEGKTGLNRIDYWVTHVKAWYFDGATLSVHYDDLKGALPDTLLAISEHIGLPVREAPRPVSATGVATNLTKAFFAKGHTIHWDAQVLDAIGAAVERILGPKPWRGLERYMANWLSDPPSAS